jgi:hypothetical protein
MGLIFSNRRVDHKWLKIGHAADHIDMRDQEMKDLAAEHLDM